MRLTQISDDLSAAGNLALDAKRRAGCAFATIDMVRVHLAEASVAVKKLRNGIRLAIAMAEDDHARGSETWHLVADDVNHWEKILKDTEGLV